MEEDINTSRDRLRRIWSAMKQRCYNPKSSRYYCYGEKGIKVCEEWLNSFEIFREWAIRYGYKDNLTIDRKNHLLGYCPENCRWITSKENNSEMCRRHKAAGTGGFSKQVYQIIRVKNKTNFGCKFYMLKEDIVVSEWGCLIDCAKYICELKNLKTAPSQIKKNISACLNGKRKKCHGFTFKFKEF